MLPQMRKPPSYNHEPTGMDLPKPGVPTQNPGVPKPSMAAPQVGAMPKFQAGPGPVLAMGNSPVGGTAPGATPRRAGSQGIPGYGKAMEEAKKNLGSSGISKVRAAGDPSTSAAGPTGPGDGGPKPWDEELDALAEQDSLYADIKENLREHRDFIVAQGDRARAGAARQAAYVSGMLGSAFGGAHASGVNAARILADRETNAELLENQNRLNQSSFALLDRKLRDEAARRGMSFQDYMDTKDYQERLEMWTMEQEAEAQANAMGDDVANYDPGTNPIPPKLREELEEARRKGPAKTKEGDHEEYLDRFMKWFDAALKPPGMTIEEFALRHRVPTPDQFKGGYYA